MSDYRKLIGKQIDAYKINGHIAAGGMADVYRAADAQTGRDVALKILFSHYSTNRAVITRFQREAQALVRLNHPNIIQMFGMGQTDMGDPYIAMEYIPHGSLAHQLFALRRQGGQMEPAGVLHLIRQVADALTIAHRNGIVHRDLKPANILIRPDGTPVLTDLGIAMVRDAGPRVTRENQMIGTPDYMSPEQVRAEELDGRSDIYSLGVMMYELFAGRPPFVNDSPVVILHQHLNETPTPLTQFAPNLPPQIGRMVHRCLEKNPAQRYQSTADISQEIGSILRGESLAPAGAVRSRWGYAALYTVLGLLVIGLGAFATFLIANRSATAQPLEPAALVANVTVTEQSDRSETKEAVSTERPTDLPPTSEPTNVPPPTDLPAAEVPAAVPPTLAPEIVIVTATPTPTDMPTQTPAATATAIPPTATPTATISEFAGIGNGLPIQFENDDSWIVEIEGSGTGSLVPSAEQKSSGDFSGRLDYEFSSAGNDRLIFIQQNPIPSNSPIGISAQVFGDGSDQRLSAILIDNDGEKWETSFGAMSHSGWAFKSASLSGGQMTHLSGPDDGQIDQPLTFYALVLSDAADNVNADGTLFIDSVSFQSAATSTPTARPTAAVEASTPTPTNAPASGSVTLRVNEGYRCDEAEHQTTITNNISFKWQASVDDSNLPAGDRFVVVLNGPGGVRSISFDSSFSSLDGEWFVFVEPSVFGLEVGNSYTWYATYLDKNDQTLGTSGSGCFSTIAANP